MAAYMAVYCHGKRRRVQLHDGYITTTSVENDDVEEIQHASVMKLMADAETSRHIDVLLRWIVSQVFVMFSQKQCIDIWGGVFVCKCSQHCLGSVAGIVSLSSIFIWFARKPWFGLVLRAGAH